MIWGLDTASRCTGIAAGDGSTMPAVGAWTFDHCGEDYGQLLWDFDRELEKLAGRLPPTIILYESPIPPMPRDKLATLRKLYSMGPYVELWAKKRGVPYEEVSAIKLKKSLTGNHLASKDEMVAMCRRLRVPLPAGDAAKDAADAFAAWYYGVQHHARQHVTAWDQAIYSRRGYAL